MSGIEDDLNRAFGMLKSQRYQPDPSHALMTEALNSAEQTGRERAQRETAQLLHQIRSIVNEYRNGEHWSSVGMERIGALLDEEFTR